MNTLFDNFSALITNDVLAPIVNYLRTNKNVEVTVQELQATICVRVTPTQPVVSTMPIGVASLPITRTSSSKALAAGAKQCEYIFHKSQKDPNKRCDKAAIEGTRFCKTCWAKKSVLDEARQKGEEIPAIVLQAQQQKAAKAQTTSTIPLGNFVGSGVGFPSLNRTVNTMPAMNIGGPMFNPNAGKIQPTAPLQAFNPPSLVGSSVPQQTVQPPQPSTSMVFLDQRMNSLGININEYSNLSNYLIGDGNIVYTFEGEDSDPQPVEYVGVLDPVTKTIRALYENEKSLVLPNTVYNPAAIPVKNTPTQPTQPTVPTLTNPISFNSVPRTLPTSGLPPFISNIRPPSLPGLGSSASNTSNE